MKAKHVVAVVASVCAAAVLAPVAVYAGGSLVTLVDPIYNDRKVRVGSSGALHVETRAGAVIGAFNMYDANNTTLQFRLLKESGERIAVTEFSAGARGTDNGIATVIQLRVYVRTSGTAACAGAGWQPTNLRRFVVKTNETVQLQFDGPPLMLPAPPAGGRVCFGYFTSQLPSGVTVEAGGTGFTYH